MNQIINSIKTHLPVVIGVAIVIVSSLQDQGLLHLSNGAVAIINSILAALGLGTLHVQQQMAMARRSPEAKNQIRL